MTKREINRIRKQSLRATKKANKKAFEAFLTRPVTETVRFKVVQIETPVQVEEKKDQTRNTSGNDNNVFFAFIEAVECIANKAYTIKITKLKTHEVVIKLANKKVFALGMTRKLVRVIMNDQMFSKCNMIPDVMKYHHINECNKNLHHTIEMRLEDSDILTEVIAKCLA